MHFRAPLRDGQVASRSPLRTVPGDRKGHSGAGAQFSCLQFAESDQHAGSFRIRCGDERSITPLFLEFLNRRNKKSLKFNKSQRFFALFGHYVVEAAGFEPVAFASRTQRSTKLSYASTVYATLLEHVTTLLYNNNIKKKRGNYKILNFFSF